jgi:hypothetical protein
MVADDGIRRKVPSFEKTFCGVTPKLTGCVVPQYVV